MKLFVWDSAGKLEEDETARIVLMLLPYVRTCRLEGVELERLGNKLRTIKHGPELDQDVKKAVETLDRLCSEATLGCIRGRLKLNLRGFVPYCFGGRRASEYPDMRFWIRGN